MRFVEGSEGTLQSKMGPRLRGNDGEERYLAHAVPASSRPQRCKPAERRVAGFRALVCTMLPSVNSRSPVSVIPAESGIHLAWSTQTRIPRSLSVHNGTIAHQRDSCYLCMYGTNPFSDAYSERGNPMKQLTNSKWLGAAAIVVGLLWFGFTTVKIAKGIADGWISSGMGIMMTALFLSIMLLATFSIYFGARVLETPTNHRIRRTSGYLIALVALYVAFDFPHRFLGGLDDRLASSLWFLIVTIAATCIHMFTCPAILRREGFQTLGYREFLSKAALLQIALLSPTLMDRYVPKEAGYEHVPEEPWGMIVFFGCLLVAWGTYRLGVWYALGGSRRRPGNSTA